MTKGITRFRKHPDHFAASVTGHPYSRDYNFLWPSLAFTDAVFVSSRWFSL
jgi:hypothetical protein